MKTGFKDPIARPQGKEKKSPWDFRCPTYDERSSCSIDAGSHYGIGHRNPIGHTGQVKSRVDTLPFGRVKTFETSYVPPKAPEQEFIE